MHVYIHMHIYTHVHKHIHMYIIEQNAKSTWMCKIKQENFVWGLHSLQLWHMFLFSSSSRCYCKGCFKLRIIYWELSISQILCWVIYAHITSYSSSLQILCHKNPVFLYPFRDKQMDVWPSMITCHTGKTQISNPEGNQDNGHFQSHYNPLPSTLAQ